MLTVATFILTWNPTKSWPPHRYWRDIAATARGRVVHTNWSVARRGGIADGDRAFLLRQHDDRGIVAGGHFQSEAGRPVVYEGVHWDGSGRDARYADVDWSVVVDPSDRLPIEILKARVPAVSWDRLQGSGVVVP